MSIAEAKSSIHDALLEQKVEVILTDHPTKVHRIPRQIIAVQSFE